MPLLMHFWHFVYLQPLVGELLLTLTSKRSTMRLEDVCVNIVNAHKQRKG